MNGPVCAHVDYGDEKSWRFHNPPIVHKKMAFSTMPYCLFAHSIEGDELDDPAFCHCQNALSWKYESKIKVEENERMVDGIYLSIIHDFNGRNLRWPRPRGKGEALA